MIYLCRCAGIPKGAMLTHKGSVATSSACLFQVVSILTLATLFCIALIWPSHGWLGVKSPFSICLAFYLLGLLLSISFLLVCLFVHWLSCSVPKPRLYYTFKPILMILIEFQDHTGVRLIWLKVVFSQQVLVWFQLHFLQISPNLQRC